MPAPEQPICDYEGSDYQASFWDRGGRAYEDGVEAIALRRLLPESGRLLLELGAGAGRNTPRYAGFQRVVLLDFSRTQLEQAQARLGQLGRYVFVAADIYRLPFHSGLFDAATMIRVLHHMVDAPKALGQIREVLRPAATFVLEFANKRNAKSILRYWLGQQEWSPFSLEPVEFAKLNFDFHPRSVRSWVEGLGFRVERQLSVSHFRSAWLKRWLPTRLLVLLDSLMQGTGAWWQLTPSVFLRLKGGHDVASGLDPLAPPVSLFKCPSCGKGSLGQSGTRLDCRACGAQWSAEGGIYDFRRPMSPAAVAR